LRRWRTHQSATPRRQAESCPVRRFVADAAAATDHPGMAAPLAPDPRRNRAPITVAQLRGAPPASSNDLSSEATSCFFFSELLIINKTLMFVFMEWGILSIGRQEKNRRGRKKTTKQ